MRDSQHDITTVLFKIGNNIRQSADNHLSDARNPSGSADSRLFRKQLYYISKSTGAQT